MTQPDGDTLLLTIVSGGQTGADRAALDWAITHHIPHGGWCPAGRLAEDGCIPERYQLQETRNMSYAERTRLNVEQSDATLIVSPISPIGGTQLTIRHAQEVGKPTLLVTCENEDTAPGLLQTFLKEHNVRVLNVAGPRASGSPEVEAMVFRLLDHAIGS